jgi:hypothetical protein
VLDRYVDDACKIKGVVGDEDREAVKLITCNAAEAQLEPLPTGKPIGGGVMLTGGSGRGKNYLSDAAVSGLPASWYLAFEVASATAFYYAAEVNPAFLKHKFIYPNEAEAVDTVVEFLRPMLSQAKAKKYVTNKNSDGSHVFQEISVEGPITGVIPTTRNTLNRELQTRLLVCELEDYEGRIKDHTAALSRQNSPEFMADLHGELISKWRAALPSLTDVRKVVIPFAGREEFRLSNEDISHGARLWGNLLGLMCAHAWLEQRNREKRDVKGSKAVVATAEDYEAAYKRDQERRQPFYSQPRRYTPQDRASRPRPQGGRQVRFRRLLGPGVAKKAGISPGTISKNRTFLTISAGLLYETESKQLQIVDDIDPKLLEDVDVKNEMKGFPDPLRGVEVGYCPPRQNPETVETRKHPSKNPIPMPKKRFLTAETLRKQWKQCFPTGVVAPSLGW